MAILRLQYIQEFRDRHSRRRFYFRRKGYPRVALPGLPGSAEFMAAYQAALGSDRMQGRSRAAPGSIGALIEAYYATAEWRNLRPVTQKDYRLLLERLREDSGHLPVKALKRAHIVERLSTLAPSRANKLRQRLRILMQLAIELEWREDDPTEHIRKTRAAKSSGHHSWSDHEIAAFEARWPVGTRERLALALLLYTGQRRADVIRMGRQHVKAGRLAIRQQKTTEQVTIPIHPVLARALEAGPTGDLTFLVTAQGRPFTADRFNVWFRTACTEAGLPAHCTPHGLRKACGARLADGLASAHEVMAVLGHRSLTEAERYTRAAEKTRLAASGIARLGGETRTAVSNRGVKP